MNELASVLAKNDDFCVFFVHGFVHEILVAGPPGGAGLGHRVGLDFAGREGISGPRIVFGVGARSGARAPGCRMRVRYAWSVSFRAWTAFDTSA